MDIATDRIVPEWPVPACVRAFVTTRAGGVSAGPYASLNLGLRTEDDPAAVAENRLRLSRLLPQPPRWLQQVHGQDRGGCLQQQLEPCTAGRRQCRPSAGNSMRHHHRPSAPPIRLADRAGTCIGAAHAGWRGLASGVIGKTITRMAIPPVELVAWIGPGIGPAAFEVGDDVLEAFCAAAPENRSAFKPHKPGKWLCDLPSLARDALRQAGVTSIHGGDLCTYIQPERFYSYRRDQITGRMAALIWLDPQTANVDTV